MAGWSGESVLVTRKKRNYIARVTDALADSDAKMTITTRMIISVADDLKTVLTVKSNAPAFAVAELCGVAVPKLRLPGAPSPAMDVQTCR